MQIFSFFRGGFPMRRTAYLLSRLLNGLLAAACYRALAFFFPAAESAAAAGEPLARASAAGRRQPRRRCSRFPFSSSLPA